MPPNLKEIITRAVLEQPVNHLITYDEARTKWWMVMSGPCLRLTDIGDTVFQRSEIEFYQYPITRRFDMSSHKYLLMVSKNITCPYYFGTNFPKGKKAEPYIRLYDSKVAMMASLYGSFDEYLDTFKNK